MPSRVSKAAQRSTSCPILAPSACATCSWISRSPSCAYRRNCTLSASRDSRSSVIIDCEPRVTKRDQRGTRKFGTRNSRRINTYALGAALEVGRTRISEFSRRSLASSAAASSGALQSAQLSGPWQASLSPSPSHAMPSAAPPGCAGAQRKHGCPQTLPAHSPAATVYYEYVIK